jgi:hypothetical protein
MSFTWVSTNVGQLSDIDPDQVIKVVLRVLNHGSQKSKEPIL